MQRLQDVRVAALDGRRLTGEVDWHLDLDLLLEVDLIEVDVNRPQAPGMGLNLADQNLLGPVAVQDEVDQVGAA